MQFATVSKTFKNILNPAYLYVPINNFFSAVYRVLCLKVQSWVKFDVGEERLLVSFFIFGLAITTSWTIALVKNDHKSLMTKLCSHHSPKNIQTFQDVKVFLFLLFQKIIDILLKTFTLCKG